jgi:hypothetical protein
MSHIQEIEDAIERLPRKQFRELAEWLRERDQQLWDEQLDGDAESGKLDFLFDEALQEADAGTLRTWPEEK